VKIGPVGSTRRRIEKKVRIGQDSQKSHKVVLLGNLADLITLTKFQCDIFMGYEFTGGRISDFYRAAWNADAVLR